MREKIIATLFVCLAALAAVGLTLVNGAVGEYQVEAEDALATGAAALQASHARDELSLAISAAAAAQVPDVSQAFGCPVDEAGLAAANTEQTPMLDPTTGQPVLNAAGVPIDTAGQPIVARATGTRCTAVQHLAVMTALDAWLAAHTQRLVEADTLEIAARAPGTSLATAPDLIIAANASGEVVARVGGDYRDWFGPSKPNMSSFAPVRAAELGVETGNPGIQSGVIVWREHDSAPMRLAMIGVAPVFTGSGSTRTFQGTVIVGNFINDDIASNHTQNVSMIDTFYWYSDGTAPQLAGHNTNMAPGVDQNILGATLTDSAGAGVTFAQVVAAGAGSTFRAELADGLYIVHPVSLARTDEGGPLAGMVAVTSLSRVASPLTGLFTVLPGVALVLFFIGSIAIIASIRQYLAPIAEIGKGVLEVISGNKDYMWPVDDSSDFSDLAHSLNIMSARLQGKRDPDAEEGDGSEAWSGDGGGEEGGKKAAGLAGLGLRKARVTETDGDGSAQG